MRVAINQPYFIPYAGYFRLFTASDIFVAYDDVQFTKGSWIHRNILYGKWNTLPIKKPKLGTLIKDLEWKNPDEFLLNPCPHIIETLQNRCDELNITIQIIRSSDLTVSRNLKGQDRVIAICEHFGATEYINASGGRNLYDEKEFEKRGIELKFLTEYKDKRSIVERIVCDGVDAVRKDIYEHTAFP